MPNKKFSHPNLLTRLKLSRKLFTGFTLIELMVAITILVIISIIGFTVYTNAQIVARDGRRKDDLRQISTALQVYYQVNGRYPCNHSSGAIGLPDTPFTSTPNPPLRSDLKNQPFWLQDSGCDFPVITSQVKPFDQTFIPSLPIDPLINNDATNPSPIHNYPFDDVGDPNSYGYTYWAPRNPPNTDYVGPGSTYTQNYILWAKLENANDPESCGRKHYKSCAQQKGTSPGDLCDGSAGPGVQNLSPKMYVIVWCE